MKFKRYNLSKNNSTEEKIPRETLEILKKAWKDLPSDFTQSERVIFIEIAEKIIKISSAQEPNSN